MRPLVIGAGAIGGYFGACLLPAGRDVTFLVRNQRAEQLSRNGLHVVSPHGDFTIADPSAIQAADVREPYDLVLVAVKSYSLDEAVDQFAPAVGTATTILPILNGMAHLDKLSDRFGAGHVLGGAANISAGLNAEGHVVQFFPNKDLVFGEPSGGLTDRTRALTAHLACSGIDARASDAIMQDMWEKWVQLAAGAGFTCLMRSSVGDILKAPGGQEAILRIFDECCAVATAAGFRPRPAFVEFDTRLFTTEGSPLKASMLRDIERGTVTEGDHILGNFVARARSLHIATPILDLARMHVAAYEAGRARAASGS